MTIKEFYLKEYPTDELGLELNEKVTFTDLVTILIADMDFYNFIGVSDSLVRERVFTELATQLGKPYEWVYNLWLNQNGWRNATPDEETLFSLK